MIRGEAWLSVVIVFLSGSSRHTELNSPGVRGRLTLDAVRTFYCMGPLELLGLV